MIPKPFQLIVLSACLLTVILCCASATAQQQPSLPWGAPAAGSKIKIVATADPKRSRKCHVASSDADQLSCSRSFGRKPQVYRRDEVDALIKPGDYSSETRSWIACSWTGDALVAGAVAIGVFAPPLALIAAIPVGILGVGWIVVSGLCVDDTHDIPAQVLYLRPGAQLQVRVR